MSTAAGDHKAADDSSSGFIHYEINDVSDITPAGIFSSPVEVHGMPWVLWVHKLSATSPMEVHLNHRKSDSNLWSIDVAAEITLVNIGGKGSPLTKEFKNTFNHEHGSLGITDFIEWKDLIDETKGFIKDDKITVEARFTLSNIMGIRVNPRVDFTDPDEPRHDVALVINGEKIYVSKQMLAVQSPVFNAMFYVDFDEKDKKEIELKDIDRKEFIDLLNLVYPTYDKIIDSNVESLLKLADRFEIKTIIDKAEQFIIDSTKLANSSKLKLSDQYKLVKLQDHCLSAFKTTKDIMDMKTTDDFKALSDKARSALLCKMMKLG